MSMSKSQEGKSEGESGKVFVLWNKGNVKLKWEGEISEPRVNNG